MTPPLPSRIASQYVPRPVSPPVAVTPQNRRTFLQHALAAGAAGGWLAALAACNPSTTPSPTVLTLWTLALKPFFVDYMQAQLAGFEALHRNVRVEWVDVAYDALERKLISAAAAHQAPDVVNMADLNFARFASLGAFADISGSVPGDPRTTYLPGALDLCYVGGRLQGLPWYVNPQTKIINTKVLAQGKLTPADIPPDWSGLRLLAPEFARRTGKHLFSQPLGEESQLPIMMLGEGGRLVPLREGGKRGVQANINTPEAIEYLTSWVELFRSGGLPREAATSGHAHLLDLFQEGRVAIISTGPNFLKRIRDVAPDVYTTTTVAPGLVGALGRVHMPVMVLAVSRSTRHQHLSAALAWHLTGAAAQTALCKQAPIMPSSIASLSDPFFALPQNGADTTDTLLLGRRVAASTLSEATAFTASLDCWPSLRRTLEDEIKRALLDGLPVATVVATIEKNWNRLLDEGEPATMDRVPRPSPVAPPRPLAWALHAQPTTSNETNCSAPTL